MTRQQGLNRARIVMPEARANLSGRTSDYRMLMHLHIETAPELFGKLLVFATIRAKQREFTQRISMPEVPSHEGIGKGDPESHVARSGKSGFEFRDKVRHDALVRVQEQDPRVLEAMLPESPGPLLGRRSIPIKLQDVRTSLFGDSNGMIRTPRVHHDHLGEGRNRSKAIRQICFFVPNRDAD